MSVKDKIAMWNNMASNNPPSINPPKLVSSANAPRTQVPLTTTHSTVDKSQPLETATIVKPSDLKKKNELWGHSSNKAPEYVLKPSVNSFKPSEQVKRQNSNSTSTNQHQSESPTMPKPSDIKKKIEQQISGNNFHFIAPIQIKKVESITIEKKQVVSTETVTYDIEKEVPVVNVKQSAERLATFYQKKAEEQSQPKEQIFEPIPPPKYEEKKQIEVPKKAEQKGGFILSEPVQKIDVPTVLIPSPPPVQQSSVEFVQQAATNEMDMTTRLKNRNKKKRINFGSDED